MKKNEEINLVNEREMIGKRFAYLCHALFTDGLGKELMNHLDKILKSPVAPYKEPAPYAYFREGQNDIIRRLKMGIELQSQLLRGEYE